MYQLDPQHIIHVCSERWTPWQHEELEIPDLAPGESAIVAEMESERSAALGIHAIGTSAHDDGTNSVARYIFRYKTEPGGYWNEMDGVTSTIPFGRPEEPVSLLPDTVVGPIAAFQVEMVNISGAGALTNTTISASDIVVRLTGEYAASKGRD